MSDYNVYIFLLLQYLKIYDMCTNALNIEKINKHNIIYTYTILYSFSKCSVQLESFSQTHNLCASKN